MPAWLPGRDQPFRLWLYAAAHLRFGIYVWFKRPADRLSPEHVPLIFIRRHCQAWPGNPSSCEDGPAGRARGWQAKVDQPHRDMGWSARKPGPCDRSSAWKNSCAGGVGLV